MNDTQLLTEVGKALYGETWQSTLSADIAVSDRSMRRWANGTDQIPWGVWFDVYRRIEARAAHSRSLENRALRARRTQGRVSQRFREIRSEKDWLIEAHEPLDGRHSQTDYAVLQNSRRRSRVHEKNSRARFSGLGCLTAPQPKIGPSLKK